MCRKMITRADYRMFCLQRPRIFKKTKKIKKNKKIKIKIKYINTLKIE